MQNKRTGPLPRGARSNHPDQNTTAASGFYDDMMGLEHDGEVRSEDAEMMNNQALNDYVGGASLNNTGRVNTQGAQSQALSQFSERQLDVAVNRLFEDAKKKKAKLEKIRMETMKS